MDAYVLRENSCFTWVPVYYMKKLMYCMNRWHVLHNRVACNTCLKEMYYMRHCRIQHAQHTQAPCLFGSKCRHIGSSLQIPHTRGHSRGLPCKGRFKASYSLSHIPYSLTHFHCRSRTLEQCPRPAFARVAAYSNSHLGLLTLSASENSSENRQIGRLLSATSYTRAWVLHQKCAHNSARRMCTFCHQSTRDWWSTLRIAR